MTSPLDFTRPQTSDNYSTQFCQGIIANFVAQAMMLDSLQTTYTAGLAQYMKRYNRTSGLFDEYNGSTWATLATNYATISSGNTFVGANTFGTTTVGGVIVPLVATGTMGAVGATTAIQLYSTGATAYGIDVNSASGGIDIMANQAAAATALRIYGCAANTAPNLLASFASTGLSLTGNLTVAGISTFTGLLTATAGVTMANGLNTANSYQGVSFMAAGSSYGYNHVGGASTTWYKSLLFNDGNNFAILTTSIQSTSGAAIAAGANTLRPFMFAFSTGAVSIDGTGAGTTFGGAATVTGTLTVSSDQIAFTTSGGIKSNDSVYGMTYRPSANGSTYTHGFVNAAGSNLFVMDSVGNVGAVANVTAYSDERRKKNWRGFEFNFTEFLAGIKSGIYDRIDIDLTQIGLSAQDVQRGIPDAVTEDAEGYLSLAYGQFAAVACVELAKEILKLRQELGVA